MAGQRYEHEKPDHAPRKKRHSAPAIGGLNLERAATVGVAPPGEDASDGGDGRVGAHHAGPGAAYEQGAVDESTARYRNREWFIHVGGATNLPSTDWNARSDPYCKVYVDGELVAKTRRIKGTCHPCWSQAFCLGAVNSAMEVKLQVYDHDMMGSDDLIGSVVVRGSDIWQAHEEVLDLPLLGEKGEQMATKSGQTALGVAFVEGKHLPRCEAYWKLRKPIMQAAGATSGTVVRPWFIVTPSDLAAYGWDVILLVAMTYAAVVTPVEVCVTRYHERYGNELEVLPFALNGSAWVVYTIFLVDTGLQFVTAYFEETVRMWVFEPFYIVERYLKDHFFLDLVSILPWRLICAFLGGSTSPLGGRARRYARALRLLELVRVSRAPRLIQRLRVHGGETTGTSQRTCSYWGTLPSHFFSYLLTHGIGRMRNSSLTLLKYGVVSLLSLHWVACVWALLPTLQTHHHGWTEHDDTLAGRGDRPLALYVQAFEFAITTMVMDQARSQPTNTFEQSVWLVVALIMGALYAYIIGVISAVVTNMDPATTEFNAVSDLLESYMHELGLDEETAERARRYLDHTELHFRSNYYRKLLEMLSPELRGVFAQQLCGVWVHSIWFFNCNDITERARFVTAVALNLKVAAYNRMECIVRVGERADSMYIVRRGIVGVKGVPFSCGKFFGEEMIRDGQWRDYNAVCATFSDLHVLHKEDLRAILAESKFPRTRAKIRLRVLYMTFQRHIKLVVKAYRMRRSYVPMTADDRAKYVARLMEQGRLTIPAYKEGDENGSLGTHQPHAPGPTTGGTTRKLAPLDNSFSASYHDAQLESDDQLRRRTSISQKPIDYKKMVAIKELHSEGAESVRRELQQAHGLDDRDLRGAEFRTAADTFQSVAEDVTEPLTKADLEGILQTFVDKMARGLAGPQGSPAQPRRSLSPSKSPERPAPLPRTTRAVDFEIADLRRKLEALEKERAALSAVARRGSSGSIDVVELPSTAAPDP